jgi:hypothetical protein
MTLVLVGEQRQGGRHIEHRLRKGSLQQGAHIGQTEGQASLRGAMRSGDKTTAR